MKETRLIKRFSEKNSYLGKWAILGLKPLHIINFFIYGFIRIYDGTRYLQVALKNMTLSMTELDIL